MFLWLIPMLVFRYDCNVPEFLLPLSRSISITVNDSNLTGSFTFNLSLVPVDDNPPMVCNNCVAVLLLH